MNRENVIFLWETPDSDFTEVKIYFIAPKIYIWQLAKRVLKHKHLEKDKKPLRAACAFADVYNRNWSNRDTPKSIRKG